MKRISSVLTLLFALWIIGCGTAPRPTPAPTLAPVVITVVITTTPPPGDAPAPPVAPTGTLTTTAAISGTATTVAAARPTNTTAPVRATAIPTRRPNTATPPRGTATVTGIPYLAKYSQAVRLIGPVYEGSGPGDRRDERQFGADALVFEWQSNGGLGEGECYLIRVSMKSRADNSLRGDSFLFCDPQMTLKGNAQPVQFTLNKPNFTPGPTYAGIVPPGGGDVDVSWSVTVARDDGPSSGTGAYFVRDASRHNITLLSPTSNTFTFVLKGAPTP